MFVSAAVLLGWALGIPWLLEPLPSFHHHEARHGPLFFLSGLSLSLLADEISLSAARRRLAQALALLVALVGIATVVEFATGWNLHFEDLLFRQVLYATGIHDPGRLSLASAVTFVCLALALLGLDLQTPRGARPAQFLGFCTVLFSLLHFLGYLYGVDDLYRTFHQNSMAVHTTFLFLLLGLGILSARPDRGFIAVFNGPGVGGLMALSGHARGHSLHCPNRLAPSVWRASWPLRHQLWPGLIRLREYRHVLHPDHSGCALPYRLRRASGNRRPRSRHQQRTRILRCFIRL